MAKLQDIADDVGEALEEYLDDHPEKGERLFNKMMTFKIERHITYKSLMRIPGFKTLWDQIELAAEGAYHKSKGTYFNE